jgi:hypothetical protein
VGITDGEDMREGPACMTYSKACCNACTSGNTTVCTVALEVLEGEQKQQLCVGRASGCLVLV